MRRGRPPRQPIDGLIQCYYACQATGARLIEAEGRVYDGCCSACGFHLAAPDGDGWACGDCGADWGHQDVFVPRGDIGRRHRRGRPVPAIRAGEPDEAMVGLMDAAPIGVPLEQMRRDARWRYPTQFLITYALYGETYKELAREANARHWPTPRSDPWTRETVRAWVQKARVEFKVRLAKSEARRAARRLAESEQIAS